MNKQNRVAALVAAGMFLLPALARAEEHGAEVNGPELMTSFFITAVLGLIALIAGNFVKTRVGELSGYLGVGIVIGTVANFIPAVGQVIHHGPVNAFIEKAAYWGVAILLVEAALETALPEMKRNVPRAGSNAVIGVVLPVIGLVGLTMSLGASLLEALFTGAIFAASSMGVPKMVISSKRAMAWAESQFGINVAAFDDIVVLVLITVLGGAVATGKIDFAPGVTIFVKAVAFVLFSIWLADKTSHRVSALLSILHQGVEMKLMLVIVYCAGYAVLAHLAGLSELMGAYCGGVALTEVHFKQFGQDDGHEKNLSVEDLLVPLKTLFIPIFLVSVAIKADLRHLANLRMVATLFGGFLILTVAKFVNAKITAAKGTDYVLIALATLARGEVSLVAAQQGVSSHVLPAWANTMAVLVVIITAVTVSVGIPKRIDTLRARSPERYPSS